MTPDQYEQVQIKFHALLPLDARARQDQLLAIADPKVQTEVARLLRHAEETRSDPITDRVRAAWSDGDLTPRQIGPYRVARELGAGGMGAVFLGQLDVDGAEKEVAIKLLHGLPTAAGARRMARERRLLATLNHPNIARHLDGGETAHGQSYLVMDFVPGRSLAAWIAEQSPSLAQRLTLFLALCEAVAHAHERLVLHRDIKPSNVVVRPDGAPVLLDFGVGALLSGDATETPERTQTVAYTPGYGAPEQRDGRAATTATDVFGLGALLFDLVSGERLSAVRSGNAPVPLASTSARDANLRRAVRGDLDRIVRKATHEDPGERYRTVQALADDVKRQMQGLPVRATPDAWSYRARKFVARHRLAVIVALCGALALTIFVIQLNSERDRAVRAEQAALRSATDAAGSRDFLIAVLGAEAPQARRGAPITVARLLANAAQRLRERRDMSPASRASAWLAIADIYDSQGDPVPGLAAVEAAQSLLPARADSELQAKALRLRGTLLFDLDRPDESKAAFDAFLALRARQTLSPSERAIDQADYGRAALQWGEYDLAVKHLTQALTLLDRSKLSEDEERTSILRALTTTSLAQHKLRDADRYLTRMARASRALAPDSAQWVAYRRVAAQVRLAQGRNDEALRETTEALRMANVVFGARSMETGEAENDLGAVLNGMSRYREALSHMHAAQRIFEALEPSRARLAQNLVNIGAVHEAYGDYTRTVELQSRALPELPEKDPAQTHWRVTSLVSRAYAEAFLGRHDAARRDLDAASELVVGEGSGRQSLQYAWVQLRRARAAILAHDFKGADKALSEATRLYEAQTDASHLSRITMARLRILLALERGDTERAATLNAALMPAAAAHPGMDPLWLAQLQLTAAEIAYRRGRHAQAARLLSQAMPLLSAGLSPQSPERAQAQRLRALLARR